MIQFDPGIWVKRLFYTPVTCPKKPPSINALPDRITDVKPQRAFHMHKHQSQRRH